MTGISRPRVLKAGAGLAEAKVAAPTEDARPKIG
jgi:hypothetical protein